MKLRSHWAVSALIFVTLGFSSIANAATILSENFEDGILDPLISIQTNGTFNSSPGIKVFSYIDGIYAFGFGRSTCGASCFENYATDIIITLSQPTSVASISFSEMEVFENWGSSGRVLADGVLIGDFFGFGRLPYNDFIADTTFRSHIFDINDTVSQLVLRVHDITNVSEIYIDNIVVTTTAQAPEPATLAIFGLGLAGLGLMRRRKRVAA